MCSESPAASLIFALIGREMDVSAKEVGGSVGIFTGSNANVSPGLSAE